MSDAIRAILARAPLSRWAAASKLSLSLRLVQPLRLLLGLDTQWQLTFQELQHLERAFTRAPTWGRLRSEAVRASSRLRESNVSDARKFLDVDLWLRAAILHAARLGLHRSPPLRIMDLGCGTGMFVFVCRAWGHDATGLDLPLALMPPIDRDVYGLASDILALPIHRASIDHPTTAAIPGTYDLITAFKVCFNGHRSEREWDARGWATFLRHVAEHLAPDGQIHLALNPHAERFRRLRFYDADTRTLFEQCGGHPAAGVTTMSRTGILQQVAMLADRPATS